MTPAMRRALELHQPHPHQTSFPDDADILRFKMLNQFRNSLLNDSWPAKVAAFRGLFGLPIGTTWKDITPDRLELQRNLLEEECNETFAAIDGVLCERDDETGEPWNTNEHYLEVVDGCLDIIYIALGFMLDLGLSPDLINLLMQEVHASNMTKVDDDGNPVVNGFTEGYRMEPLEGDGPIPEGFPQPGYDPSKPTGKVLKSHNYTPVDLQAVISGERP